MKHLSWVELSKEALLQNVRVFRELLGRKKFCAIVKGNAYGHGIKECVSVLDNAPVDWFGVNSLEEAIVARSLSKKPIYIMGYVALDNLEEIGRMDDVRIIVYNKETVEKLGQVGEKFQKKIRVHLKVETGNHRQGVLENEVLHFAQFIGRSPFVELEGIATHFSNIEDTDDPSYAHKQLDSFKKIIQLLEEHGISIPMKHCANSAATLLFSDTHFDMARVGIALYGLFPSEQIIGSLNKESKKIIQLRPVLTWKSKIAQIKNIPSGAAVGYGCTYVTQRATKMAIVPVGYFDGYDRSLSNKASVEIRGKPAPVMGRVCMNIIMVDVTDIDEVFIEDEVVLMGDKISAEDVAAHADTIHYEMITRIREGIPRMVV